MIPPLPSLDQLAQRPELAAELPAEEALAALARMAPLQVVLLGRLAAAGVDGHQPSGNGAGLVAGDRLLGVEQAAQLLSVTKKWIYANHKRLPFTRKLSRKQLRFSEAGLLKWIGKNRS